jgi:hypothetical protein
MKASYQVSLRTIKEGKSHTITHTLMLLAAKLMVNAVTSINAAKQVDAIPLSNNTVHNITWLGKGVFVYKPSYN